MVEDIWQRFKQETEHDVNKIRNFLNEMSHNEKSPRKIVAKRVESVAVSHKPKAHSERKKIYGKLKDLVKELMERENLSRAQAYRVAKKNLGKI